MAKVYRIVYSMTSFEYAVIEEDGTVTKHYSMKRALLHLGVETAQLEIVTPEQWEELTHGS